MQVDLKKLKPVGIVLVLLIGILTIVTAYTINLGVPPRYTPMHDTEYYQQHMEDLLREVQGNILPDISGIVGCELSPDGSAVVLRIEQGEFDKVKAVIERDFGESLFVFETAPK